MQIRKLSKIVQFRKNKKAKMQTWKDQEYRIT